MGFLSSCSYVHTTIWMHHIDTNKMHREKATWELHKNDACHLEQILEVKPHKTAAVSPLTSHLTNHRNKTNKTCRILLEKQEQTHKQLHHMLADQQGLTYISSVQTYDEA